MNFICHILLPILLLLGTGDAMEGSLRLAEDHHRDRKNSNGTPSGDRKLKASCPTKYNDTLDAYLGESGFFSVCDFPVLIKDYFKDGLPAKAANATAEKGLDVGRQPDGTIYRLSADDPCADIVKTFETKGKGATYNSKTVTGQVGVYRWTGNILLVRPAGQVSHDPRIPDGKAALLLLDGAITFKGEEFEVLSYKGKAPFDICAALSKLQGSL